MLSCIHLYCLLKQEVFGFKPPKPRVNEIEEIVQEFILNEDALRKLMGNLEAAFKEGLGKDTNACADVKMFPTYVRSLPNGTEKGNFLALDLGGTNFRVLMITLKGKSVDMRNKIFPIPDDIMVGKGTALFNHIVSCIALFMEEEGIPKNQHYPLGFTFSFPCKQEGLNVGRLVRWTKGFQCEGVEGHDVVRLFHEAIHRHKELDIECVAILNDTVGCLMSTAFSERNTKIGVILGTGTNACYMENLSNVELWDRDRFDPKQVIINTEWGAFGENGTIDFLRTETDRAVDSESLNPGKQLFEKMISGMYMGEIVRRLIVKCTEKGLLFNGLCSEELKKPGNFFTKYLSEVEKDELNSGYTNTKQILDEVGIDEPSLEDCKHIHYICEQVSTRAANLASAGVATILNRIEDKNVTVAMDGSLYRYHPHFQTRMEQQIKKLAAPGKEFRLELSVDGSGRGAAVVAAVAYRLKLESKNNLLEVESDKTYSCNS